MGTDDPPPPSSRLLQINLYGVDQVTDVGLEMLIKGCAFLLPDKVTSDQKGDRFLKARY